MPRKKHRKPIAEGLTDLRAKADETYLLLGLDPSKLDDEFVDPEETGLMFQLGIVELDNQPADHPVKRMFLQANLNINNPLEWFPMMNSIAKILLEDRKRGAPKKQDAAFRKLLFQQVAEVMSRLAPESSDLRLVKEFRSQFGHLYPSTSTDSGFTSMFARHNISVKSISGRLNRRRHDREHV